MRSGRGSEPPWQMTQGLEKVRRRAGAGTSGEYSQVWESSTEGWSRSGVAVNRAGCERALRIPPIGYTRQHATHPASQGAHAKPEGTTP
jgi:hypothetical protein